ncbi:MAG: hypothetical protein K9N23_21590 [Akkermansiaceae bacterium]|nr:hypothetical protein [Akkermansiaceae bacterium]
MKTIHFPTIPALLLLALAAMGQEVPPGAFRSQFSDRPTSFLIPYLSRRLISGAGDSTVRVWDVAGGKESGRLRFGDSSSYTHAVGLSPNGDVAFALVEPGHLVVARVPSPK